MGNITGVAVAITVGLRSGLRGERVARAAEKGLILLSCGVRGNVIRILAPLTIPLQHVDEGLAILADAMADCA